MVNKKLDFSNLPRKKHGDKILIDWISADSVVVPFIYDDMEGEFIVSFKERIKGGCMLDIIYNNKHYEMANGNFKKGKISTIIGKRFNKHRYAVGEIVNGLEILEHTYVKDARNNNALAYKVKCVVTKKEYVQTQFNMSYGYGSKYLAGNQVWEDNWLYNEKHLHKFIKNPEDLKKVSIASDKKILCVCPNCKAEKYIIANSLYRYGLSCDNCRPTMSYPERFMKAYLQVKNIEFIYQYRTGDIRRFIDFYLPQLNIAIETHGGQHYENHANSWWAKNAKIVVESDNYKRQYCKENNIKLVELDCRKSYFNYIKDSVNNTELPDILPEDEKLIKIEISSTRFNSDELKILEDYKAGKSSNSISKKYGVHIKTVTNIARRHGVYKNRDRHKRVKCINTGKIYDSIADASRDLGIPATSISNYLNGKKKYAGKIEGVIFNFELL